MSKTIVKRSQVFGASAQVLSMNGNRTVVEMSACHSRDNKSMFFFSKKKKIQHRSNGKTKESLRSMFHSSTETLHKTTKNIISLEYCMNYI